MGDVRHILRHTGISDEGTNREVRDRLATRIDECVRAATADERRRRNLYERAVEASSYGASGMVSDGGQRLVWNPEAAWFEEACTGCRLEWYVDFRRVLQLLLLLFSYPVLLYIGLLFMGSGTGLAGIRQSGSNMVGLWE